MYTRSRTMAVLSILLVAAFVLSACQPVVQTVEVVQTQVVEREVEVVTTQEVEVIQTQVVEVERGAFTTPHPILSDLRVRQAMAYCTNKLELIQSVYPLITPEEQEALVMDTFIPKDHWAYAGDENVTIYPFDPDKGMALLDEAGWTMAAEDAEFRTNAEGEALSLKFTTTNAAFRQTWAAVWEQQMANCGIQSVRLHAPASWWFGDTTGLARRDFELGAYAWVGQADPGGRTLWACDQIPFPENGWEGQNTMGWCNEKADTGIKNAVNTLDRDERIKWYLDVQQAYTEDVPAIPLFNRTETFSAVEGITGFSPTPGEEYYTYNAGEWAVPGQDTIVMGYTQEPASLFGLVESAAVAQNVLWLIGSPSRPHTTLEYDYQPVFLKELPSLENGTAVNEDVEVTEGTMVIDADGNLVELAPGVTVLNSEGETVEFTGDPVTMKQMTVNYEWRDDLMWPDGQPISQADLELSWKVKCDKESGATTYTLCDQTADIQFDGLVLSRTGVPGEQDPTYYAMGDFWVFPAHREISDGRTLAEVEPVEFATLPEVAETPWGFGPYMITEWVKGERLAFEPHPHWFGGTPATPNFVVSIVTPENAEAQLLGGQVDVLTTETLAGLTESLVAAADAGQVINISNAGATWEHIDINMFVR